MMCNGIIEAEGEEEGEEEEAVDTGKEGTLNMPLNLYDLKFPDTGYLLVLNKAFYLIFS